MGEVVGRIPQKLIPKSMAVKIDLSGGSYRLALRQRMRQPGHLRCNPWSSTIRETCLERTCLLRTWAWGTWQCASRGRLYIHDT
jgi:hypothetical protein